VNRKHVLSAANASCHSRPRLSAFAGTSFAQGRLQRESSRAPPRHFERHSGRRAAEESAIKPGGHPHAIRQLTDYPLDFVTSKRINEA